MSHRKKIEPTMTVGGPSEQDARALDRTFEQVGNRPAGTSVEASVSSYGNTGTRAKPRLRRRDNAPVRVTTVQLPAALLKLANLHCVEHGTTFSSFVEDLIGERLQEPKRRAG